MSKDLGLDHPNDFAGDDEEEKTFHIKWDKEKLRRYRNE